MVKVYIIGCMQGKQLIKGYIMNTKSYAVKSFKEIGSQVKIKGTNLVGTLVKKGFIFGNFMYTVDVNGAEYNVFELSNV